MRASTSQVRALRPTCHALPGHAPRKPSLTDHPSRNGTTARRVASTTQPDPAQFQAGRADYPALDRAAQTCATTRPVPRTTRSDPTTHAQSVRPTPCHADYPIHTEPARVQPCRLTSSGQPSSRSDRAVPTWLTIPRLASPLAVLTMPGRASPTRARHACACPTHPDYPPPTGPTHPTPTTRACGNPVPHPIRQAVPSLFAPHLREPTPQRVPRACRRVSALADLSGRPSSRPSPYQGRPRQADSPRLHRPRRPSPSRPD